MAEDGSDRVTVPVVFYDGKIDINIGKITVHLSLGYKELQTAISQRIGISPNQITTYLIDHKKRKILVTGKVNFAVIARETECCFLVVLKRSRKERKKLRSTGDLLPPALVPEKMILLRRISPDSLLSPYYYDYPASDSYYSSYVDNGPAPDLGNYSDRLQNLQIQRENYLAMISNPAAGYLNSSAQFNANANLGLEYFPTIQDSYGGGAAAVFCEECAIARKKGYSPPFHCCVYDSVAVGFRSPVGPIRRPFRASR